MELTLKAGNEFFGVRSAGSAFHVYAPGLYRFSAMTTPNPRGHAQPPFPGPLSSIKSENADAALTQAHFVIYKYDCGITRPERLNTDFTEIGRRSGYTLYAHRD